MSVSPGRLPVECLVRRHLPLGGLRKYLGLVIVLLSADLEAVLYQGRP
jgi:hypothetical protein